MNSKMTFYNRLITAFLALFLYQGFLSAQADFEQSNDEDGLVIIEAENFSDELESSDGSSWEVITDMPGFTGSGAVQATHPDGTDFTDNKDMAYAQVNAPVLKYTVNFVKADPVYVWARASHVDGYDDSVWPGLDDAIVGTSDQSLTYLTDEQSFTDWYYINHGMDGNRFIMTIPSVGEHTFELYYRETNLIIDQVILTTNADYDPNADAPTSTGNPLVIESSGIYPNPVVNTASIKYTLQQAGMVNLTIFNSNGQKIETLVNSEQTPGTHEIKWQTQGLAGGLYFYRLNTADQTVTEKFIVK